MCENYHSMRNKKKSSHCFAKRQSKKQINMHFERLLFKKKKSSNILNDHNGKNIAVQRAENAEQRCHFRRRCNSFPAGNFRSQRWIRKRSAATSVLALLLLHTSARPTKHATETYVYVYILCVCVYTHIYIYTRIYI